MILSLTYRIYSDVFCDDIVCVVEPDDGCEPDLFLDESNSDFAYRYGVCPPMDASLTNEELDRIIEIIHACFDIRRFVMKKIRLIDIIMLQSAVMIYSLSTLAANFASQYDFLSPKYILFFGLDFVILAIYAIVWQQIIKRFQLSIAYANKALTLMWSMLWNFLILSQGITVKKVIGVIIVVAGVIVMNYAEADDESTSQDNKEGQIGD